MELGTTSYAILALLAVRPWSTYELAQQMDRSLAWFWPSAQSVVYEAPKELARLGLASASKEYTGRRGRTVYTITPEGRRALSGWMDGRPSGPRLEWEGLLKVAFGDVGTQDQLLANLAAIRADAEARRDQARARAEEYEHTGGPFPDRMGVIAITGKILIEWAELTARWAAWAHDAVERWDEDGREPPPDAFQGSWTRAPET